MSGKELRLQPRLQCIADCVQRGARLADIGTDHGYLPVWLLQNGRIDRAIASDINDLPLRHARHTAELYGVAEQIDFRLCAGLDGFSPEEADVIAIAGMGGETIIAVLDAAKWLREYDTTLLLQPMTRAELLRPWLAKNGYRIISERLVRDKGVIYTVLTAEPGASAAPTRAEAWCGAGLERDPLYGDYARDRIRKLDIAAEGLRRARNADTELLRSLEADAAALREKIKEWENVNGI